MVAMSPDLNVGGLEFPEIKRAGVTDQAIESILDLVRRGVLRPGDRLPPQRKLVSQMGLSQTAVREALRALATIGVIETRPGYGTFVRSISPEMLVQPESLFFVLERETLLHALDVRMILEVEAIALAAQRATADDLKALETTLQQIEQAVSSGEKSAFRYSPHFHLAIAKATHNPILLSLMKPFIKLLVHHAAIVGERHPQAKEIEYRSHAYLLEPILKRDAKEARRRMRLHLEESGKMVVQAFSEAKSYDSERSRGSATDEERTGAS
jgi:GntR family transcriptional regulator, transcriptional repressor for pyruvate dehydrogenase complex